MSSIAYNLTRKMEWMGRRLRKIDDVDDIKQWVSAMREINDLLKEVDIKECENTWRPWSQRIQRGKRVGKIDQGEVSSGSDIQNNEELKMLTAEELPHRATIRPPRVEVEGDDVEMLDPKAAVMKMLRDAEDQQERIKPQGELSLYEKKKNKEMWRNGVLERVKKEKVPVEYWDRNRNFRGLIADCAPQGVRVAVIKDLGYEETIDYLYKELLISYDTGQIIGN